MRTAQCLIGLLFASACASQITTPTPSNSAPQVSTTDYCSGKASVYKSIADATQQDTDKTMALYEAGEESYRAGEYAEAAHSYAEAYMYSHQTELLFNVGQSHRMSGEHQKAIDAYSAFLCFDPGTPMRAQVEKLIEEEQTKLPAASI